MIRLFVIAFGLLANTAAAQGLSAARMAGVCDGAALVERSDVIAANPNSDIAPDMGRADGVAPIQRDQPVRGDAPLPVLMGAAANPERSVMRAGQVTYGVHLMSLNPLDGSDPSAGFCP